MNGVVTLVSAFGVTETKQITHTSGDEIFNAYLEGVYINRDTSILKNMVTDKGNEIQFLFNGYDDTDFKYNAMATNKMVLIENYD